MKILLVNPSQRKIYGKMNPPEHPPIGLAYIGAVLEKEGHRVKIIDEDAENMSEKVIRDLIKEFDVVGLTCTTPTFKSAENFCRLVKTNTDNITILGGIHATIDPASCMKSGNIDFLVRGEGELTIIELIKSIENKKDFSGIKGISFRKKGKVIHNPSRELINDLDTIPFPAMHLFDNQKYTYPDSLSKPVMPIITSRGCPHGCTYCCTKNIFTRKVRFRSAKNVVEEIELLRDKYKVKEIHFWDDNFTLNKKRVFEIMRELKKRNIKLKFAFPNGLRVDQIDEQTLRWLKEMGVYSVSFGVESGNQQILDNVEKGITLSQVREAYRLSKKVGLETWAFFILGLPGDTPETIEKTLNFAIELNPDVAKFHILKPFPGTKVFNQLKEEGLLIENDYSKYGIHTKPVHRLPSLSADELFNLSKLAYRKFYLRPSKIFSHALRIKSFERLKINLKTAINLLK